MFPCFLSPPKVSSFFLWFPLFPSVCISVLICFIKGGCAVCALQHVYKKISQCSLHQNEFSSGLILPLFCDPVLGLCVHMSVHVFRVYLRHCSHCHFVFNQYQFRIALICHLTSVIQSTMNSNRVRRDV